MFCPLLVIARPEAEIGLSSEHDCLKEDCAWWDSFNERCSVLTLARQATIANSQLHKIAEDVSHGVKR